MSQRITIDLVKNPDVAKLVSDKEVGSPITLETTIVNSDDQTLTLELEEASEGKDTSNDESGEPADQSETEPSMMSSSTDTPAMAVAKGNA